MADISQIKLPNGDTYNLVDETSGYTSNVGTITKIKTTAGTHNTIDISSGAATFNVPTTAAHVGINFGYTTSGNNRAVLQDSNGNLYVTQKDDNSNTFKSFYGTCDTAAATAAKVVTLSVTTGWQLVAGTVVGVKFTNTNTAQNPTLNINNTGAKSIYVNNATVTTGNLWYAGEAGRVHFYMYDGSYWVFMGHSYDWNSDTKVTLTALTPPSSGTSYFPTFHTAASGTTGLNATNNYYLRVMNGTTSANGYVYICAGNSTASGTAGNMIGGITLYGTGSYYTDIKSGSPTANRVITLPNKTGTVALTSDLSSYLPLTGGNVTGPVNFGDSVSIDSATIGNLIVNGGASFVNSKAIANQLIDSLDTASANWTDNTLILTSDVAGDTNLYYRRDAVKAWNYIDSKISATGYTKNTGTITSVKTTAGAHTAINTTSGAVSFNVPTTAAHVGIKFGYTTSGNNRAVLQDSSGNLYVTQKDSNTTYSAGTGLSLSSTTFSVKLGYTTSGNNRAVQADSNGNLYVTQKDDNSNTTYTLSGALSSHKFTSTLTAGGSGSGTSTSEITFVAGSNVTLTDDTTNKKITIAATDTTYSSKAAASGGTDVSLVTTGEKYTWNSKTSNTGTITSVKTTAGAHTTINTTSGAVSFNVPTTAAHVGIKFGYTTSGNNRAVLQDSSGNLYVTQKDNNSGGTVTSITLTQGAGISIGSSGTAITTSGTRTIALSTSGVTAGSYGAANNTETTLSGYSTIYELGITVDKYGRVTDVKAKPKNIFSGDILCANAASGTSTSVTSTITQIPLTQTLVDRNYHSNLSLASNRIAITTAGTYRITGSVYITTTKASSVGVYIMKGSGAFSNATEIASSYIYVGIASSNSINVTKTIEATAGTYIYLAGRASAGGTVASGNVATYLEVEELRF